MSFLFQSKRALSYILLSALLALVLGYLAVGIDTGEYLIVHLGYYFMAAVSGGFAFLCWKEFGVRLAASWRVWGRRRGLWLVLIASAFVVFSDSSRYKVLYDEHVLQTTAQHMHLTKEVSTVVRAYTVEGSFSPIDTFFDKRPYFFTFLICLAHDLTGYREANLFIINALLVPLCLGCLYWFGKRLGNPAGAFLGLVLMATLPLFCQVASGGGMELHNVTMIMVTLCLALYYLDKPEPPRVGLLCLSTVLLSQSRYESVIFVVPTGLVLLYGWWKSQNVAVSKVLWVTPLLFVPYAWHNRVLAAKPQLWQLSAGQTKRFSLEYLQGNLEGAWSYFSSTSGEYSNSLVLALVGAASILVCVFLVMRALLRWRQAGPGDSGVVLSLFGLTIFGNLVLLQFYYWARLDDPQASRFSLPTYCLLALCATLLPLTLSKVHRLAPHILYGFVFVFTFGLTLPQISKRFYTERILLCKELEWEGEFFRQLPPCSRLVITNRSCLSWLAMETPAVTIGMANARADQIAYHMKEGTFGEVYVFELLVPGRPPGTHHPNPLPNMSLSDRFQLETLKYHSTGDRVVRVSKVVRVHAADSGISD